MSKSLQDIIASAIEGPIPFIADRPKIDSEIFELSDLYAGSKTKIGGIITSVKKMITKKGMKMFKLNIDDVTSGIEVIVFPKEAKNIPDDFFSEGDIIIVSGSIAKEGDEENSAVKVIYSSSEKVDHSILSGGKSIFLRSNTLLSNEIIQSLYDIINNANGSSIVFLEMLDENKKYTFKFNKTTSTKVEKTLRSIVGLG